MRDDIATERLLREFCRTSARGVNRNDLLYNRTWVDPEEQRIYFRLAAFRRFLQLQGIVISKGDITGVIRYRLGGDTKHVTLKGCGISCWYIPRYSHLSLVSA
jgi:hypothetical protein